MDGGNVGCPFCICRSTPDPHISHGSRTAQTQSLRPQPSPQSHDPGRARGTLALALRLEREKILSQIYTNSIDSRNGTLAERAMQAEYAHAIGCMTSRNTQTVR